MRTFLYRLRIFSFDTNLSRSEIRRYVKENLPEFRANDVLRLATETILAYVKHPDGCWAEDLQASIEDGVLDYYGYGEQELDRQRKLVTARVEALHQFCSVVEPGLLETLENNNFNFKRLEYEVEGAQLLGVGMAVSIAIER